jgi:predicted O-methyltransferase YrrM
VLVLAQKKLAQEDSKKSLVFRNHDFELQEIFNELRKSGEYPILDVFVFADSGPEPYSPALNESVSRLQLSGLIGRENPDYASVILRPAANRFFDEVVKHELDSSQIEQLTEVASKFLERAHVI